MRGETIALQLVEVTSQQLAATVAAAGAGSLPSPPEAAREPSSVIAPPPHPPTLAELVGPPLEGVSPLDQFREALLLMEDMDGKPHAQHTLSCTSAELLRAYRGAVGGGYEQKIRAIVDRAGLAKKREVKPGSSMTHAMTASDFYSRGFVCPIFLLSYQHSTKTDAYGIGISLLMILTGEPAAGLHAKWEDALFEFEDERERNAIIRLCNEALAAARWSAAVARSLA